ncbi:MAG: alpha/beta fold hydrolase [Bacteroidia bacterium]|nr:alpha/beta fold hydrolase [Bacteroidia bacterium]
MRLKASLLILLCSPLIIFGQSEEIVTLDTGTNTLEGSFLNPAGTAVPVVLIIAGSGPTDRNGNNTLMKNNCLKMLAEGLYENGIATLRYDKRGIGGSALTAQQRTDTRFDDMVNDAKSWVGYLQTIEGVGDIHVLGHSQGSLVGILTAQTENVTSVISVAGLGAPGGEIIREQLKVQPPILQEQAAIILDSLKQGHDVNYVHPMLQSLFQPALQPYVRSWIKYDPKEEIAKLEQAVLIVNGTEDIQVGVDQAEKLNKAHQKSELLIIEKMNHILKDAEGDRNANMSTYYKPDLPLSESLVPEIVKFIKAE